MSGRLVLGLGASQGATFEDALALAEAVCAEAGRPLDDVSAVATLDRRADHPALVALCAHLGLTPHGLSPATLGQETARLAAPSDVVARHVGIPGVCEAAALSLAGPGARLLVPKRKGGGLTAALAEGAS